MKIKIIAIALIVSAAAITAVLSATDTTRPPGIGANAWVPITESLGIVIVVQQDRIAVQPNALLLIPPAQGYLMIKQGDLWRRLQIIEPISGPGGAG